MGRKGANTTFDQRQLVIYHHTKGKTERELSDFLKIPRSTIGDIIRRFKNEDRIDSKPNPGRPKILNDYDKRIIMKKVRQDPRKSAPSLAAEMAQEHDKKVHPETIRRAIRENGYNGRVARKKPFISEINKQKRKKFAKEYLQKDFSYWKNVIFVDESKFNIFGSDGRVMVWRKPNEELNKENLRPTVKHGGGSVMVWGCMSAAGVGNLVFIEGNMDKTAYLTILKNNLKQSAEKMGISSHFNFYQDNDPKHKSYLVREWLLYNCPKVIETPPQSPDLNPIENLWNELDVRIRKHPISSKAQLKERLVIEWNNIQEETTANLVKSMPNRLKMVINQNGYPTKY